MSKKVNALPWHYECECVWVCRRVLTLQQEKGSVCHSSCAVMRRLTRTSHPMTEKWPFPPSLFLFPSHQILPRSVRCLFNATVTEAFLNYVKYCQPWSDSTLSNHRSSPYPHQRGAAHTHDNEYRHRSANEGTRMLIVETHKWWQIRLV